MKVLFPLFMIALIFGAHKSYTQQSVQSTTEPGHHMDVYHGQSITDSYMWLEDMNSTQTQQWVEKQSEYLQSYLTDTLQTELKQDLNQYIDLDLYSTPIKRGAHYYYAKTSGDKSKPAVYRQKGNGPEHLIHGGPAAPEAKIAQTGASSGLSLSKDGHWLTYNVAKGDQRWIDVHTYHLTSKTSKEVITGLHQTGGGPVWKNNEGFFYNKFKKPAPNDVLSAPMGNAALYFHKIETSQLDDHLIMPADYLGIDWLYNPKVSETGAYLVIGARQGSSNTNRIYLKNLKDNSPITGLLMNDDANYSFIGSKGHELFFYTDLNAPNGRVVSIDLNSDRNSLKELIPESRDAISAGSLAGGNAIGFFNEKFIVKYTHEGEPLIKIFDLEGNQIWSPQLPVGGSVWGGFVGEPRDSEVFYQFLGLVDPSTIYALDLKTGQTKVFKHSLPGMDTEQFVVEKVFYPSIDGTKVPMFIAYKKGFKKDGSSPGLIYGYGAFGWVSFIWFQPHLISWLQNGGIYAQPSIRGGGEYGRDWHLAGVKTNKQNSIDDFVSASKWLIANNYVNPSQLAANGGSISASVVGAALNQNPDLYGACILDRPALDMLRFPKFTGATHWIQELGSPDIKEEFEALRAYSPYHNLKEDTCYPPTLVMVGDRDETTPPLHAYKYVAKLQNTQCKNQKVFLKLMMDTAHNFGNTKEQRLDSRSDELAFLIRAMDLHW